jgi:uncharacterized protein YndB with AHSA1/START domain
MMTHPSVTHATFTLERTYPVPPERVFAAFADPDAKARWFAGPDSRHQLDFRVGGREVTQGRRQGADLSCETVYHDIVPGERIVYTSSLAADGRLSTVSLTTIEFDPDDAGTRLALTEQGAFIEGFEQPAWREQGTSDQLHSLAAEVTKED